MFNRRQAMGGVVAFSATSAFRSARSQTPVKSSVKIRYSEVVRAIFYAPVYAAMTKGFFNESGLDVVLTTAQGGDKSVAALLSNSADIALIGPETAIYVQNSDSPTKIPIFSALTAADGFMLVGRDDGDQNGGRFDWQRLKGKEILSIRPGSTPDLFLQAALRLNGLEPGQDVRLVSNIAIPARIGSWLAGQNLYAIFLEPDASQLELDGKAHVLASIGQTVGPVEYTTFMATDRYIRDNPAIIQSWTNAIYKAQRWTAAASASDIAQAIAPFFPGVRPEALLAGLERYRKLDIWKTKPAIDLASLERFQDILVQGGVLEPAKQLKVADLVRREFANAAK